MKLPPARAAMAFMVFFTTFTNYMYRSTFQMSIEAMIKKNDTKADYGPRYEWSQTIKWQCIAAMYYSYTLMSPPGGAISEIFGPVKVLFISSVVMAICTTLIVPLVLFWGWGGIIIMRLIIGVGVALQYPAIQTLIGRWAPPAEKGKFSACLLGNVFANIVLLPATGMIIVGGGWDWSFYYVTLFTIFYLVALCLCTADTPEQYRWIKEEEVNFIREAQGGIVGVSKSAPPYKAMMTSIPFWALIAGQFGNQYGLFFVINAVPGYLNDALGYKLKDAGFLAALPHLGRLVSGFMFGGINDFVLKRGVEKSIARKVFCVFSHILCGIPLLMFYFAAKSKEACIGLLTLMMFFNGAAVATVLVNTQDLAPNWAGTQYGIMNFFGGLSGILGPQLLGAIVGDDKKSASKWCIVFAIGGCLYIITGIIWMVFGKTDIQPWNAQQPTETTPR